MLAALVRLFGTSHLTLAEDIVQDTLMEAISNWTYKGIPDNHRGWLYTVAKNKTLNALKKDKYKQTFYEEELKEAHSELSEIDFFSEESIVDDQLRMMFMCCHPSVSEDSQIALILKTLGGFSMSEIAKAFLSTHENINKRLTRARQTIRENKISFEVPSKDQLDSRVKAVLEAIYLLFNEGYSASKGEDLIRKELCQESIRLTEIMVNHEEITHQSDLLALLALMQLNTSRFSARVDEHGNILTLSEQDRTRWDYPIMEQGFTNLRKAGTSEGITKYHIMASISAYHCAAKDFKSTNWKGILSLYERLLKIDHSSIVTLNYAIALSETGKTNEALRELNSIESRKEIRSNYLFYSTKAEFLVQLNQLETAKKTLAKAIEIAPLSQEKTLLSNRFTNYFGEKNNNDVPIG